MLKSILSRLHLPFLSLRFRLMAWFGLVLAVVLVAFSAFIYTRQAQDLRDVTLNRLAYKTRQLEELFQFGGLQSLEEIRQVLPALTTRGIALVQEDEVLVVADARGEGYAQIGDVSPTEIALLVASANQAVGAEARTVDFRLVSSTTNQNQDYLVLITPVSSRFGGVQGYLMLGRPADPTGQLPRLLVTLGLASLAVLAGAAATGYGLAARALRPVQTITRAAREISETDLSRRLNLRGRDELGELAGTFDGMLARLEAAFERQRQFTADASHELRTPLTIIGLETTLALEARRSPGEYERALRVIAAENEHMARLVNDLLTLARMDAGQAPLHREALDLSDVALEVIERLAPLAAQKGVRLEAGDLPETPVEGDRGSLAQVLSNLVENAIKYAPPGEGRVRVQTGAGGGTCWARVEDNGPGIAPQHLARVFERFYRADQARAREEDEGHSGGSGLGLAIAQGIARAHGGEVAVESEVGQGTAFELRLPGKG
jgi:heavy metal sensor kinase